MLRKRHERRQEREKQRIAEKSLKRFNQIFISCPSMNKKSLKKRINVVNF
jgi:hypothetical protein